MLDGVAHRTPLLTSRTLDARTGAKVVCKAENLQRGGAFKFRGAFHKLSTLTAEQRAAGVIAYSSGNHAGAVALASRVLGVDAGIVMPHDAPAAKRAAVEEYGAEVVGYDKRTESREDLAAALAGDRGLTLVRPFDDWDVMAGQGTVALELLDQAGPLDQVLVPVGGGGLVAGCATVIKALSPGTAVIGVEPEAGDDTRRSLAAGERVRIPVPRTIADGQQLPIPGELTFEVVRRHVAEIAVASDPEIVAAMRFLFERLKTVAEPSGACALAALLAGRVEAKGLRVGVTISGGNVAPERFSELLSE